MKSKIEIAIGNEPISEQARHSKLFTLEIQEDLEMLLKIKTFAVNENGVALWEAAATVEGLTQEQRDNLQRKFWPIVTEHSTKVNKVNAQGQVDENGIPEKDFLQSLTIAQIKTMFNLTDNDSFLEGIYKFIEYKINDVVTRGKI